MNDQNGSSENANFVFPEKYRTLLENATSGDTDLNFQALITFQSMDPYQAINAVQDLKGFVHHFPCINE